jgi:hypothetical protein
MNKKESHCPFFSNCEDYHYICKEENVNIGICPLYLIQLEYSSKITVLENTVDRMTNSFDKMDKFIQQGYFKEILSQHPEFRQSYVLIDIIINYIKYLENKNKTKVK